MVLNGDEEGGSSGWWKMRGLAAWLWRATLPKRLTQHLILELYTSVRVKSGHRGGPRFPRVLFLAD